MGNGQQGYAVVTGASSGIGRAIAVDLASRGYDLFLVSRNESELSGLASELRSGFEIEVEYFVCDLSTTAERARLVKALASKDVAVLVNNAGFGVKGDFADTSITQETALVATQIDATLELIKTVLPSMQRRKDGIILNVGSVYSFSPVPRQAVYAACKSFLFSFSLSLKAELRDKGITVSVLSPGITRTRFRTSAGITDKPGVGMSAEVVAKAGVEGALRGDFLIVPGLQNKLFVMLTRHLPFRLSIVLIDVVNARRGV